PITTKMEGRFPPWPVSAVRGCTVKGCATVRSFAGIRSFVYRVMAVSAVFAIAGIAATPMAPEARGDAPLKLAVYAFENSASAPPATAKSMGAALYQAVATSGKFAAAGGGPLPIKLDEVGSSFGPAIDAAAKVGADEVIVGNIVQAGGGTIAYSLSIYRVVDVALVRSQMFTQNYPASDSRAMTAAFAANVATLEAPRTAEGTIYSTANGELDADLGTAEGFRLGQRFNVLRLGQKVAEAEISSISDSYAVVKIGYASPGFKPAVGDRLVGLEPQPAVIPPHENSSGFNPLYALVGIGAALLAIGHHGQPAPEMPQPIPSSSSGTFQVTSVNSTGDPQHQPVTIVVSFSQPFNATTFDPSNDLALAFCNVTSQGATDLRLTFLGTATYLPTTSAATSLTIVSQGILQQNDHVTFTFIDGSSNGWTDNAGDIFLGGIFQSPFRIGHKPLTRLHEPIPHPVNPNFPKAPKPVPHASAAP
ncbi:MAG TPA: hypothetical protein VJN22_04420, partial [Candidatus Eremiobacteraceae bacterium]|nr:hypothetical protein [Candidatus Eremiobacteraceae bacterium]